MKDVGGLVTDYQRQTEIYRKEGREVRLHECRSACTMALSLPNVCVYPTSVLRFHQAYNRDTKEVDHRISEQLFSTYPEPIRKRLGYLTRHYRSLSGAELIDLGVRNCNESPVMFARRKQGGGTQVASAAPAPSTNAAAGVSDEPSAISRLAGRLTAMLTTGAPTQAAVPATPARTPVQVARAEPSSVPLPPVRPENLSDPAPTASIPDDPDIGEVPLPPVRPAHLGASVQVASVAKQENLAVYGQLPKMITGAWPVLPPAFSAYAPLR
jgi:hypothetical protein